jgi:hypothetical protein
MATPMVVATKTALLLKKFACANLGSENEEGAADGFETSSFASGFGTFVAMPRRPEDKRPATRDRRPERESSGRKWPRKKATSAGVLVLPGCPALPAEERPSRPNTNRGGSSDHDRIARAEPGQPRRACGMCVRTHGGRGSVMCPDGAGACERPRPRSSELVSRRSDRKERPRRPTHAHTRKMHRGGRRGTNRPHQRSPGCTPSSLIHLRSSSALSVHLHSGSQPRTTDRDAGRSSPDEVSATDVCLLSHDALHWVFCLHRCALHRCESLSALREIRRRGSRLLRDAADDAMQR